VCSVVFSVVVCSVVFSVVVCSVVCGVVCSVVCIVVVCVTLQEMTFKHVLMLMWQSLQRQMLLLRLISI